MTPEELKRRTKDFALRIWLEIIHEGKLLQHTEVELLRQEAEALTRIMSKSRDTARKKD